MDTQDWDEWGDGEALSGESGESGETADLNSPDDPIAGTGAAESYGGDGGDGAEGGDGVDEAGGPETAAVGSAEPGGMDEPLALDGADDGIGAYDADTDGAEVAGLQPADSSAGPVDDGVGEAGDDQRSDDQGGDGQGGGGDPGTVDTGTDDQGGDDALFGVDPHTDPTADSDTWDDNDGIFPPELGISDPPEPVDGFPWSDATLLGDATVDDPLTHDPTRTEVAEVADLAAYDGLDVPTDGDAWAALFGSDDPATSALARWWAPGA